MITDQRIMFPSLPALQDSGLTAPGNVYLLVDNDPQSEKGSSNFILDRAYFNLE